jgi:hypothetical protein
VTGFEPRAAGARASEESEYGDLVARLHGVRFSFLGEGATAAPGGEPLSAGHSLRSPGGSGGPVSYADLAPGGGSGSSGLRSAGGSGGPVARESDDGLGAPDAGEASVRPHSQPGRAMATCPAWHGPFAAMRRATVKVQKRLRLSISTCTKRVGLSTRLTCPACMPSKRFTEILCKLAACSRQAARPHAPCCCCIEPWQCLIVEKW